MSNVRRDAFASSDRHGRPLMGCASLFTLIDLFGSQAIAPDLAQSFCRRLQQSLSCLPNPLRRRARELSWQLSPSSSPAVCCGYRRTPSGESDLAPWIRTRC